MMARFIWAPWSFALKVGRRIHKLERVHALLYVMAVGLGCTANDGDAAVVVFAAASLTDAFTDLDTLLRSTDPDLHVRTNFAGSQQLAQQIFQGAHADIFATADERWMTFLVEKGLAWSPTPFATTNLVVVGRTTMSLRGLSHPNVRIVVGTDAVPVGAYTQRVLSLMQDSPSFGAEFVTAVRQNIVSEEDNVRGVLAKVLLGEADAGFVYASDVVHLPRGVFQAIEIPADVAVSATYYIARASVGNAERAEQFVRALTSVKGRELLVRHGFAPI